MNFCVAPTPPDARKAAVHERLVDWCAVSVKSTAAKGKRRVEKIHHPLLEEFYELEKDETWRQLLHRGARGKLPRWFAIRDDRISVRIKNNLISEVLPTNPAEGLAAFKQFVSKHDNIAAPRETDVLSEPVKQTLVKNLSNRRHFRKQMLAAYVNDAIDAEEMTPEMAASFAFSVHVGFALQYFKSKDIVVDAQGSRIVRIDGLVQQNGVYDLRKRNLARVSVKKKSKSASNANKTVSASCVLEQLHSRVKKRVALDKHRPVPEDEDIDLEHVFLQNEP